MANYQMQLLREGYDGVSGSYGYSETYRHTPKQYVVLTKIECEPEDEVLVLPASDSRGEPLTHIGYRESFDAAHEEWADWHHPSKGCDYVPDRYSLDGISLDIPSRVKRIVIPETVCSVSRCAFAKAEHVILEVDPRNPWLRIEDNQIVRKR